MNYKVNLSLQAKNDLQKIFQYIAIELQSPQNAIGQLDRLENSISSLNQMPEQFRVYDHEPWRTRNLRVMPVDNYLVFYLPNHADCTVTVMRVMYGRRNVDEQLNQIIEGEW